MLNQLSVFAHGAKGPGPAPGSAVAALHGETPRASRRSQVRALPSHGGHVPTILIAGCTLLSADACTPHAALVGFTELTLLL